MGQYSVVVVVNRLSGRVTKLGWSVEVVILEIYMNSPSISND